MIQKGCGLQMMLEKLEDGTCRKQICGHSDSLAKTLVSPENKKELNEEQGPDYFMRLCALLTKRKKIDPNGLSLKMLKICYLLTEDEDSSPFSLKWGGRGYSVEWKVCNSKDYGVPQNRERVFIIGHLGNGCTEDILYRPDQSEQSIIQVGNIIKTESFGGNPQRGRVYSPHGLSPTLNCVEGGGLEPKILLSRNPNIIRKLTPREFWRLQGFTDQQFNACAEMMSNAQLYKQAGNAVTVNVVEEIGRHIKAIVTRLN